MLIGQLYHPTVRYFCSYTVYQNSYAYIKLAATFNVLISHLRLMLSRLIQTQLLLLDEMTSNDFRNIVSVFVFFRDLSCNGTFFSQWKF